MRRGPGADERGSGTVLVLALVAVLGVLALVAVTAGSVALARHQAEKAADLGALAGADGLGRSSAPQACATARRVVEANAATLESCVVEGEQVVVVAVVWQRLPRLLGGGRRPVRGAARAGREPPPATLRRSVAVAL